MINVSFLLEKNNNVSIPAKAQEKNQLIMSSNPSQNACNIMFSYVFIQRVSLVEPLQREPAVEYGERC